MPATFDRAEMIFKTFFFPTPYKIFWANSVSPNIVYLKRMKEMLTGKQFATLKEEK